jgi:hypothetical protein
MMSEINRGSAGIGNIARGPPNSGPYVSPTDGTQGSKYRPLRSIDVRQFISTGAVRQRAEARMTEAHQAAPLLRTPLHKLHAERGARLIASIAPDNALILPHRANPATPIASHLRTGHFHERQYVCTPTRRQECSDCVWRGIVNHHPCVGAVWSTGCVKPSELRRGGAFSPAAELHLPGSDTTRNDPRHP